MCTFLSLTWACENARGMSDTTYQFFFASIVQDNIIALMDNAGELISSISVFSLDGCPSAHPHAFIVLAISI